MEVMVSIRENWVGPHRLKKPLSFGAGLTGRSGWTHGVRKSLGRLPAKAWDKNKITKTTHKYASVYVLLSSCSISIWETFWSRKVHNKICLNTLSMSVRHMQINHDNSFWFDFLYGCCTWTHLHIVWENPASKTSQEQWGDHVSSLQHSIPAEIFDPEAYHSLVPINTKPGPQSSTALIVPQWKQGNWIVVFIDVFTYDFQWWSVSIIPLKGSSGIYLLA